MKLLIATLLAILACQVSAEFKFVDVNKFNTEICKNQFGITDHQMLLLQQGLYSQLNTRNFKCFIKCGLEQLGVMENDDFSFIMHTLEASDVRDLTPNRKEQKVLSDAKLCLKRGGRNPCDVAFRFVHCVHSKNTDLGSYAS